MANCHEMKVGEVYTCEKCGISLKVIRECEDCHKPHDECECEPCTFTCCGEPLKKQSA